MTTTATRPGRDPRDLNAHWLRTVLVAMSTLGVTAGFTRFSFAVALPEMTEDLFRSYSTAGAVLAVNFIVYLGAVVLVGRYAQSIDPSRIVQLGVALAVIGMLMVAAARTTSVAMVATSLLGLAAAGGFIPVTSIIVSVAPPERRGVAMGLGLGGIGLSIVLTGQTLALVDRWTETPWRAAFVVEAAVGAVILLLALVFLPPLRPVRTKEPRIKGVLGHLRGGWALLGVYGIYGVAASIYTGYLVSALREDRGFTAFHAVMLSSSMGGAMAIAVVVGRLSDAIGRKRTMVLGTTVIAGSCLAVSWGVEPWLAFSAALAGVFINGVGAVVGAYVGDHLTTPEVTAAMGALSLAMATAQIVAPPVGGWLADATGSFTATFMLAAAMAMVAAICASRLPGERRERSALLAPPEALGMVPDARD